MILITKNQYQYQKFEGTNTNPRCGWDLIDVNHRDWSHELREEDFGPKTVPCIAPKSAD